MIYSFAPMEGVTTAVFRQVHARCFPGVDRYYAPFLAPDGSGKYRLGSRRDILPENNRDIPLVPQVLCNRAEPFLAVARELGEMGYREVNLNLGCPSATVVPKHKGAGLLQDLNFLDDLLAELFSRCELQISVKTRLGLESTAEFPAILEVYNRYPIRELIIHARDRAGMYRSQPDLDAFAAAFAASRAPVCYNGNVFSPADRDRVCAAAEGLSRIMLGRGAVTNPALFRVLRGGRALEQAELLDFLTRLESAYTASGLGDHYTLGRMKECWHYVNHMFPDCDRALRQIQKAQNLADYRDAVTQLFARQALDPDAVFSD